MIGTIVHLAHGLGQWRTSAVLGLQDIELRYKRSLLGPFWISATLVATVLALAYVFSEVFQQQFVTYVSFLAAGLLAWQLILALVSEGAASAGEHTHILQNVPLPMNVIAGRVAVRNGVVFVHNLFAIVGILVIFGVQLTPIALWVIPGAAMILLLGYLGVMVLAPICARFRDVPMVIQSAMQVMFFVTPIFWMPETNQSRPMFIDANPFYHLIELVRAPLLGHEASVTNWTISLWCCAGALTLAFLSVALSRRQLIMWL